MDRVARQKAATEGVAAGSHDETPVVNGDVHRTLVSDTGTGIITSAALTRAVNNIVHLCVVACHLHAWGAREVCVECCAVLLLLETSVSVLFTLLCQRSPSVSPSACTSIDTIDGVAQPRHRYCLEHGKNEEEAGALCALLIGSIRRGVGPPDSSAGGRTIHADKDDGCDVGGCGVDGDSGGGYADGGGGVEAGAGPRRGNVPDDAAKMLTSSFKLSGTNTTFISILNAFFRRNLKLSTNSITGSDAEEVVGGEDAPPLDWDALLQASVLLASLLVSPLYLFFFFSAPLFKCI